MSNSVRPNMRQHMKNNVRQNMNRNVRQSMNSNVRQNMNSSVRLHMKKFVSRPSLNMDMELLLDMGHHNSSASRFPNSSVRKYPNKSAEMFLVRCQNKSARMSPSRSATK